MTSNTTQSKKDYFLALGRKIYLTPSDSQLEDCCFFLGAIDQDIKALENLDLTSYPIYYGRAELSIPFGSLKPLGSEEENRVLLDSLVENYEITNIRSEDKKEQ